MIAVLIQLLGEVSGTSSYLFSITYNKMKPKKEHTDGTVPKFIRYI
jgi:hypothetical protein